MPSLYEISIPVFISNLKTLSKLLEKGRTHVAGNDSKLLESRLIDDMQALPYQIQRISDTSKGVAVRVGKVETVPMDDNEKTFPELQERIAKTIAVLEKVDPETMNAMEDQEVTLQTGNGERKFTGKSYVLTFALENFFFHMCIAYALLRKEGVPLGKADFMGTR